MNKSSSEQSSAVIGLFFFFFFQENVKVGTENPQGMLTFALSRMHSLAVYIGRSGR